MGDHNMIIQSFLQLMEETLHSNQGMYTNPGTSLLETLNSIDYKVASRKYKGLDETIAGHVYHAKYYLNNMLEMFEEKSNGDFDVSKSWQIKELNEYEWKKLKDDFLLIYEKVMSFISSTESKTENVPFSGILAMISHSAYHLGAIRQLKDLIID